MAVAGVGRVRPDGEGLPARREGLVGPEGLWERPVCPVAEGGDHGRERARAVVEERSLRDLGSTRVIQRRFNLAVPRARVQKPTSMLRNRSER